MEATVPSPPPLHLSELAEAGYNAWLQDKPTAIAVDTETTGVAFNDTAFCVTIGWDRDDGDHQGFYFELPAYAWMAREILLFTDTWIFHNAKFDLQKLIAAGIVSREWMDGSESINFEDTEAMAHLLDEHRRKGLKFLAQELLGEDSTAEAEEIKAVRRKMKLTKADGYHLLPREVIIPYAIKDVVLTYQLWERFKPELEQYEDLLALYEHEKKVTLTLLDMETRGMALDTEYVDQTTREYGLEAVKCELAIRVMTQDEEFNPNSPKQVMEAFAARGVQLESTDKATLASLDDPLAEALMELRTLRKMHGTYLTSMQSEQIDGIIHPNFRQHGTKTGRMSSGGAEN